MAIHPAKNREMETAAAICTKETGIYYSLTLLEDELKRLQEANNYHKQRIAAILRPEENDIDSSETKAYGQRPNASPISSHIDRLTGILREITEQIIETTNGIDI